MARSSNKFEYIEDTTGILPCPWCGEFDEEKQNFLVKTTESKVNTGWVSIRCDGCGCNPSFCVRSFDEAIRLWNSRVTFCAENQFKAGVAAYKRHLIDLIRGE